MRNCPTVIPRPPPIPIHLLPKHHPHSPPPSLRHLFLPPSPSPPTLLRRHKSVGSIVPPDLATRPALAVAHSLARALGVCPSSDYSTARRLHPSVITHHALSTARPSHTALCRFCLALVPFAQLGRSLGTAPRSAPLPHEPTHLPLFSGEGRCMRQPYASHC